MAREPLVHKSTVITFFIGYSCGTRNVGPYSPIAELHGPKLLSLL